MRLYQHFNLGWVMAYPYDQFGDLMAECKMGRASGFFPTPHVICETMCRVLYFSDSEKDYRAESCMEPALGTGRMLLHSSDYSMMLYGMDISMTCVKAAICNAYFYAPWMAKPIGFLKNKMMTDRTDEAERIDQPLALPAPTTDRPAKESHHALASLEEHRPIQSQVDLHSDKKEQLMLFEVDEQQPIRLTKTSKPRTGIKELVGQVRLFD